MGALVTLGEHGLDGDAELRFEDDVGRYRGTAANFYQNAIIHSNNLAYDRLVRIAGFDEINTRFFSPDNGFPNMKLECPYYP